MIIKKLIEKAFTCVISFLFCAKDGSSFDCYIRGF